MKKLIILIMMFSSVYSQCLGDLNEDGVNDECEASTEDNVCIEIPFNNMLKLENMSLEDPEYIDGKRYSFGNCSIVKIKEPDHDHTWPSFSLICKTVEGWKLYFKSSKIKNLKVGDIISFNAKVKTSKEGISFLSHVSKIEVRV